MMKTSIADLSYFFNTNRMVAEYASRFYVPLALRYHRLAADDFTRAKDLAAWREMTKERAQLEEIVALFDEYEKSDAELAECRAMQAEHNVARVEAHSDAGEVSRLAGYRALANKDVLVGGGGGQSGQSVKNVQSGQSIKTCSAVRMHESRSND